METQVYRVPEKLDRYPRTRNSDAFDQIQELRAKFGDAKTCKMLGIKRVSLDWIKQPLPVVHLAILLHRMAFRPGVPLTIFELLTACKYEVTPQEAQRSASQRAA